MPSLAQLKLATASLKQAAQLPGLLTQPAGAGAEGLGELQRRIYLQEPAIEPCVPLYGDQVVGGARRVQRGPQGWKQAGGGE